MTVRHRGSAIFSSLSSRGSGFTKIRQHMVIITTARINGGAMISINSRFGMANLVYRYKFWGLPKGVSIPPRLAAIFCMIKVNAMYFPLPVVDRTNSPRGRNVKSAMSFAISMEPMNVMYTSTRMLIRAFLKTMTIFLARV